ncbi:SDR family NAD(P)-dependent oxidoreductase [Paraburkholderia sp.]|jgi:short-subunit dehydrogenase|uniref:SDR family NAD(P)-dependent oxidoreductase n=1 Tax=Paraburkholderia sp. TaxID=1926495 RepID=UPI002F3E83E3
MDLTIGLLDTLSLTAAIFSFINVSSIGGKLALPQGGWYHASKFALEENSDALRNEVRPFGIDVVVIRPGGVKSEWSAIAAESAKRHSSRNAYSSLADKLSKALANQTGQPEPKVTTDLVVAALKAKRPKVRYSGGQMAKSLLFFKWCLPDRLFDWLIMSALK